MFLKKACIWLQPVYLSSLVSGLESLFKVGDPLVRMTSEYELRVLQKVRKALTVEPDQEILALGSKLLDYFPAKIRFSFLKKNSFSS